jgi:carboxymethylenebutenolidase
MQLVRSFQVGELSRRDFLRKATLAVGSVATANLLLAACASSPAENPPPVVVEEPEEAAEAGGSADDSLVTETVNYEDADGETLMGYLARPADGDPQPAVVVIQEWWGLNEHIKDVTRRFAREGFVALAPDLYHGAVTSEPDEARKLVMELDMAEAVREIQAAIDYLQTLPSVAGSQAGIVGFCMGGGLALETAVAEADIGAAVAFYGRPLSPERAAQIQAPVLGLYGADDGGIPVDDVRAMEEGLNNEGIENEIHIYEGAGHAFFNDTRESYNEEAATDAWERTLNWFRQRLSST